MAKAIEFIVQTNGRVKATETIIQHHRWRSKCSGLKACFALLILLSVQFCVATVCAETLNTVEGNVNFGTSGQAQVIVTNRSGSIVSSVSSDRAGNFSIEVPTATALFPLSMRAVGKRDLLSFMTPDYTSLSFAITPSDSWINLNLLTTFIVKTAQAMRGGLTKTNLDEAKKIVLKHLSFGVDSKQVPDPVSTPLGDENIDKLIVVNEMVAEWVRRIDETLMIAGHALGQDRIIQNLAGDLTDEIIDGVGPDTDVRVAATANLVATEMIVEILNDRFAIRHQNATERVNKVLAQLIPDTPAIFLNPRVTVEMQTRVCATLEAVQVVTPGIGSNKSVMMDAVAPEEIPVCMVGSMIGATSSAAVKRIFETVPLATIRELKILNALFNNRISTSQVTNKASAVTEISYYQTDS